MTSDFTNIIVQQLDDAIETKQKIKEQHQQILKAGLFTADILERGKKILLCGNGGSAADAQHIAAELTIRYKGGNERMALPAMTLSGDPSTITACSNDYGFDRLFARQIEAFGNEGDLLWGFSTSGNSANIIAAVEAARKKKMFILLFLGSSGGKLKDKADIEFIVPSTSTARIQEAHITTGHIICSLIEKKMFHLD